MSTLDVVLLNSGNKPTFVRGDASSTVDLTFVSSSLAKGNCFWKVLDTYTASDHCAILWEVSTGKTTGEVYRKFNTLGWKVSAFDTAVYTVALDTQPINSGNAENKSEELMKRITEACDASMPRKRGINNLPSMHWWNDHIATLRKECLIKRRASQRGRKKSNYEELVAEYKNARRSLRKAIRDSKRQCWRDLIEEVENDP
ncbi:uncharacterized protein [Temnothorax longispinosus]|uniref:uncharacterized protein n=1 Tax=Temnothorax longispinosus TaxID=300112 RepID=UPI003A9A61EE